MPASGALVACAVSRDSECVAAKRFETRSDPLWLVSETGVAYPVANAETASALGIRAWTPAPMDALRSLPAGPALDLAQAQRTVDVLLAGG